MLICEVFPCCVRQQKALKFAIEGLQQRSLSPCPQPALWSPSVEANNLPSGITKAQHHNKKHHFLYSNGIFPVRPTSHKVLAISWMNYVVYRFTTSSLGNKKHLIELSILLRVAAMQRIQCTAHWTNRISLEKRYTAYTTVSVLWNVGRQITFTH